MDDKPFNTKEALAEQKAIYEAAGRALTSWGRVEDSVCKILCAALNPRKSGPTEWDYWAISSFDGRLKMTDRALQERLEYAPEHLSTWGAYKLALEADNTTRNKVAHGTVVWTSKTKKFPKGRWVLAPYYHARKRLEFLEQIKKGRRNFQLDPNPKKRNLGLRKFWP